ncbi:Protein phosphatase 1 regulatory subunit 12A (130 kDa myosin-binding subunit of smooth muscle myosin phosphatase) (Myosin phosphatase-targeting subunit 1) (Myosin phosphatase target subunit 1) (PP1M subunit M110) (Protein phosphatase myosin-binding subunit), partial [Durusdinium trenchii]
VMSALADRLENEGGWKAWVEEAGAVFCVKQREMDERQAAEIERVRRLLDQRADVNKVDVDLYTPLHRACDKKDVECTALLLEAKADPDVSHPGLDGWTPLHVAAWKNSRECVELLIAAGADCNAIDWYGKTPISLAGKDAKALMAALQRPQPVDTWKNLRQGCVMQPSAVHLANIERCTKASANHGEQQGDFCSQFDASCKGACVVVKFTACSFFCTLYLPQKRSQILEVLPLHLLEKTNAPQMQRLFELFRRLPSAIHFYLETNIFPNFMRFQEQKFSASGQEMGGSILFKQRLGFSGTPSELMPRELGQCEYEPGSEGEVVSTLTSPSIVSFKTLSSDWTVEASEEMDGEIHRLALVTGLTNKEVAEHLLGLKKRADGTMPLTLPDWIEGVVFIEEDGAKRILNRQSREVGKLADSGVPISARFCFYDQIHTTGMDIQHRLDAVAALTLGKDMVWRDFAQGAYRMRGIGRGQSICLYIIPEIEELISRDLGLAHLPQLPRFSTLGDRHKGVLDAVACWLLCQSMRTEKVQYAMLQLQNLANIWRRSSLAVVMEDYEAMAGMKPDTLARVQVYKEPIDFKVPSKVPHMDTIGTAAERRIADAERFVRDDDRPELEEIRGNMLRLAEAGGETQETEGERGLETEQQREQEQERQQEVEEENQREQEIQIEKFVDLMHCRDHEEPVPWDADTLAVPEEETLPTQFYEARDFCLWKRQPLKSLPEECLLSRNWFDPQWSGFRRVKNVYMQLEWATSSHRERERERESHFTSPVKVHQSRSLFFCGMLHVLSGRPKVSDKSRLQRAKNELPLTRAEEHEMHRKMHLVRHSRPTSFYFKRREKSP